MHRMLAFPRLLRRREKKTSQMGKKSTFKSSSQIFLCYDFQKLFSNARVTISYRGLHQQTQTGAVILN